MSENLIKAPQANSSKKTLTITIAAEKNRLNQKRNIVHDENSNIARPRDLPYLTGLSRTTIWRLERAGEFPRRIRLSAGAVGYRMADIQAWLDSRKTIGGLHDI